MAVCSVEGIATERENTAIFDAEMGKNGIPEKRSFLWYSRFLVRTISQCGLQAKKCTNKQVHEIKVPFFEMLPSIVVLSKFTKKPVKPLKSKSGFFIARNKNQLNWF